MKITMYELLGLVKEGKAPKKFKYDSYVWAYNYESSAYWNGKGIEFEDYMDDGLMNYLNDEVEIIEEEKKISEKLFFTHISNYNDQSVVNNNFNNYFKKTEETINQLIDYLKSKGE